MAVEIFLDGLEEMVDSTEGSSSIRQKILQLAIRGKLVPQKLTEEPASVLLERIAKENLVSPARNMKGVGPDDELWRIPEGWKWCRLRQITDFSPGKTPPTKEPRYWSDVGSGHAWVSISDMENYGTVLQTKRRVSHIAEEETFRQPPKPAGTLLMSFKLTVMEGESVQKGRLLDMMIVMIVVIVVMTIMVIAITIISLFLSFSFSLTRGVFFSFEVLCDH